MAAVGAARPSPAVLAVLCAAILATAATSDLQDDDAAAAAHAPPHARHLFGVVRDRASAAEQRLAVDGLLQRLLPRHRHLFGVDVRPGLGPPNRDTFQVVKQAGCVNITASSGVAAAWGLHHYLTQVCGCQVSWDYDQLNLPDPLPDVNMTVTSVDRYRYYQNVCTTSYSFVWWDWARWERELDWAALNGINMALAFTGQEAVWARVYRQLGLDQDDIDRHFTGPAFLAWQRMGNVRGWAGPLPESWHSQSLLLQHRILGRMRELGMVAVLPAFAGHVPRGFQRLFPNASTTPLQRWNRFPDEYCCPLLLDPTDPAFKRVGTLFMREVSTTQRTTGRDDLAKDERATALQGMRHYSLIAEFGTDHIYNCDTFNEMTPADGRPEYLAQVGKAVFDSLVDVDPKAVWMIQNWLFVHDAFWTDSRAKALLTSVPTGRMLVLDLMAELHPQYLRLQSYYGQPFIWCMLHNFGGTLGLYGAVNNVNRNVFEARAMAGSTMVGTGLTMEGTGQNYVMYDFANELAWRAGPANLTSWFSRYAARRYGAPSAAADQSWQLLKDSVYTFRETWKNHGKYIVVKHPSLRLKPVVHPLDMYLALGMSINGSVYDNQDPLYSHHGRFVLTLAPALDLEEPVWYRVEAVRDAWRALLAAAPALRDNANYRHDVVDLARQGLQLAAAAAYKQVVVAFNKRRQDSLRKWSSEMLQVFSDLDRVLSTDKLFMLGPWLRSARQRATTELEEAVFEWNARNQLTLWGPRGEIKDYAAKQWAGLVSHYYRPRWERFLGALDRALSGGEPFNQTAVGLDIFTNVEQPFTLGRESFPAEPSGDAVALSQELYTRWSPLLTTKAVLKKSQALGKATPKATPKTPRSTTTEPTVVTVL